MGTAVGQNGTLLAKDQYLAIDGRFRRHDTDYVIEKPALVTSLTNAQLIACR